jgi:hypothetical protein
MFYNKINNDWYCSLNVHLPAPDLGVHLSPENRLELQGWVWYDEPPLEYLEWLEKQDSDPTNTY